MSEITSGSGRPKDLLKNGPPLDPSSYGCGGMTLTGAQSDAHRVWIGGP